MILRNKYSVDLTTSPYVFYDFLVLKNNLWVFEHDCRTNLYTTGLQPQMNTLSGQRWEKGFHKLGFPDNEMALNRT